MSDYYVGFFVVPASSLELLHRIEDEALRAIDAWQPDQSWRLGLVFQRAAEVAVVSEIVEGPCTPLTDNGRNDAYFRMREWLMQRFLDGNPLGVLDPEQLDGLVREFERTSLDEFFTWNAGPISRQYHEVEPERLVELYEALNRSLHATTPGSHGLVYTDLWEEDRHPPEPDPDPDPEPPLAPADRDRLGQLQRFSIQARINRQRRPWWVDSPHEEARVLLGLITRQPAEELARAHDETMAMIHRGQVLLGLARLEQDVIPRVEAALIEPVIETVGGPVQALCWLRGYLRWKTRETPAELFSPEQAVELDRLLDQLLDDEALAWMFEQERHWPRAVVRDTCRKLHEMVKRAVAMGHGFVWYFDELRGGEDLGDDPKP